jgi:hypothetical protein
MRKKISTTIYVTPEQADKLKLLHERTKVPVAVYIREGIDLVLRHYAHMLPGQLALVADPPPEPRDNRDGRTDGQSSLLANGASGVASGVAMDAAAGRAAEPPPSAAAGGKK